MNLATGVWLLVSAIGLAVSLYLCNESRLDLKALDSRANGRRTAALSRLLRETMRGSVHTGYLMAGLASLGVLPRDIIAPLLIWGNAALIINSTIEWRTREHLFATRFGEPRIERPEIHD